MRLKKLITPIAPIALVLFSSLSHGVLYTCKYTDDQLENKKPIFPFQKLLLNTDSKRATYKDEKGKLLISTFTTHKSRSIENPTIVYNMIFNFENDSALVILRDFMSKAFRGDKDYPLDIQFNEMHRDQAGELFFITGSSKYEVHCIVE